jgi:hypothetical protein
MALIGIGSRSEVPGDIPQSFADARRALAIRLHSATPQGASAYDELGFYRLIYAAHRGGAVEDYVRQWLGTLLDYDHNKNSELVSTLAEYFEHGGNYNESAAALHIHRSTLRYRLDRIRQLTNYDIRDVVPDSTCMPPLGHGDSSSPTPETTNTVPMAADSSLRLSPGLTLAASVADSRAARRSSIAVEPERALVCVQPTSENAALRGSAPNAVVKRVGRAPRPVRRGRSARASSGHDRQLCRCPAAGRSSGPVAVLQEAM